MFPNVMGDSVSVLEAIGTPSRLRLTRKERGGVRNTNQKLVVYYESIKRELKIKPIYECRCDERLKTKGENLHVSHTLGCSGDWNT